jgi:hypothetical protein
LFSLFEVNIHGYPLYCTIQNEIKPGKKENPEFFVLIHSIIQNLLGKIDTICRVIPAWAKFEVFRHQSIFRQK